MNSDFKLMDKFMNELSNDLETKLSNLKTVEDVGVIVYEIIDKTIQSNKDFCAEVINVLFHNPDKAKTLHDLVDMYIHTLILASIKDNKHLSVEQKMKCFENDKYSSEEFKMIHSILTGIKRNAPFMKIIDSNNDHTIGLN